MFVEGQKVKIITSGRSAKILSGPHKGLSGERWLVEKENGYVLLMSTPHLSAVDDRREIVARAMAAALGEGGWDTLPLTDRTTYLAAADDVLAALDAAQLRPLAAGDKIRILRDGLLGASVGFGDIFVVCDPDDEGDGRSFSVHAPERKDGDTRWYFQRSAEGTGWERV